MDDQTVAGKSPGCASLLTADGLTIAVSSPGGSYVQRGEVFALSFLFWAAAARAVAQISLAHAFLLR